MAISDFLGDVGLDVGEGAIGASSGILLNFTILVVAFVIAGAGALWWISHKSYNKTIHIFEEINGNTAPAGMDKAKEIILPFTSIRAFFLKKKKIYLPRPALQTGLNHYWFFIREDGEWMNIRPSNVNKSLRELGLKHDHSDMRMANASLKKLVEKNYKKLNWIKEYAPYIAIGVMILMLGIVSYLNVGESAKVTAGLSGTAEALQQTIESLNEILGSLDNIKSGSGIRTVGT